MKKFKSLGIVATAIVLLIIAVIGFYIYTNSDAYIAKKIYNSLGNDYTVAQCDSIILLSPDSEYAKLAEEKKQTLLRQQREWNAIANAPTVESIKNYKSKHTLTETYSTATDKALDSLLWIDAIKGKLDTNYDEYLKLGEAAHHYTEASKVLQLMKELPFDATISANLQNKLSTFYEELGNGNASKVADMCADTVSFFLFHQNQTKKEVANFINKKYCKNIKTRTFTAPSNIEFHKARINNDEAGYAILFDIEITSPKKVARKHSACVFLNKEGKITYVAHKPFKHQ